MRIFLLLSALFVASACNVTEHETEIKELEAAHEKWVEFNPQNYEYNYRVSCFCVFHDEVTVVVENNEVVAVLNPETKKDFVLEGSDKPIFEQYPTTFFTINEFFDQLKTSVKGAARVELSFDSETGMPIETYVDGSEAIADDETGHAFRNLKIN